ncbi:MAG: HTTM domain-containing protein [Verrucomicrobiota bacterium]
MAIDLRSLAAFRIAIGGLLLADLAIRAGDLGAMYTDEGMFSRVEICRRVSTIWNWSFHFGGGTWNYQALLFGLAAVLALALLAGLETRLATIGSWLMLVSLHHRVPPILSGADLLLRMLLFWGMFLPLGGRWSLDRWRRKRGGDNSTDTSQGPVLSVASAAILLQMALMYLFSAIFKSNSVWFRGETIAGAMAHDFYASPVGAYLLQFPRLLMGLTWATLLLEWIAPVLMFVPKWTGPLRIGCVAALAALHVGIAICLEVDLFSPVSMAGLLLFLPTTFWRRPLSPAGREAEPEEPAMPDRPLVFGSRRPWLSGAAQGLCLLALVYVLAINLNGLPRQPFAPLAPEEWKPLITGCALGQKWNMFEDVPSRSGWYVARARLRDGSEVDLLRQGAVIDWSKPSFPAGLYPNHRWRKLFREMAYDDEKGYQVFRAPVAEFLCRNWNARHPAAQAVVECDLVYCMQSDVKQPGARNMQMTVRERLVHLENDLTRERWLITER